MKNKILLLTGLFLVICILACNREKTLDLIIEEDATLVYSSPDLKDITSKWVSIYSGRFPESKIRYVDVPETSIPASLKEGQSIAFLSEAYTIGFDTEPEWKKTVGREVIVPIISERNPYSEQIKQRGISISEFSSFVTDREIDSWSKIDESWEGVPLNLYIIDNPSASAGLAKLLSVDRSTIDGAKMINENKLLSLVKSEVGAVGFCYLNDIVDYNKKEIIDGVSIVPIDRNGNGKIDYMENIYGNLEEFGRGVWIGKYPGVLSNNLYSISTEVPTGQTEKSFLRWVITNGQPLLGAYGYSNPLSSERLATLNMLKDTEVYETTTNSYSTAKNPFSFYLFFPIAIAVGIVLFLAIYHYVHYLKEKRLVVPGLITSKDGILDNKLIKSPQGLYYDKTHTWAFMEKDGLVKVGIDDFLQHLTGPITSIKMKKPGDRTRKGSHILSIIQNGKQLDIYAAVTGTIVENNEALIKNSSAINSSPYTDGWIYRIEPSNWIKEIQFMFMGTGYREWLKNEFTRFKEFLTNAVRSSNLEYARVLQDGGEIKDGILKDFGPKVWEDFQSNFIDISV